MVGDIEDIFEEELKARPIFKNLDVLSPHYVPEELPHRDAEIKDISRILAPVVRNEKPNNIFIYGKTGTGKTCVVRLVKRKLEGFVSNPEKNPANAVIRNIYMNCKVLNSKYQVLLKTAESGNLNDGSLTDNPLADRGGKGLMGMTSVDLYERVKKVVESNSINLILILDEIDQIKKGGGFDDLIYGLTRINDELSAGSISVVCMSNDIRVVKKLGPRTKSTLCEEEMVFEPYNAIQLGTILKQRIYDLEGFKKDSIDESAIALISAIAAQDGDARYALKLLQKSGEIAKNGGDVKVLDDHVEKAKKKVEEDIIYDAISTLPEQQQIVLYSIAKLVMRGGMYGLLNKIRRGSCGYETLSNGILTSGDVFSEYERQCEELNRHPRTMRSFETYLNELEMLGLITMKISGKGFRGNTRLIRLGYPPKDIEQIVKKNFNLE